MYDYIQAERPLDMRSIVYSSFITSICIVSSLVAKINVTVFIAVRSCVYCVFLTQPYI